MIRTGWRSALLLALVLAAPAAFAQAPVKAVGGVLERLDSVIFAAPVYYHLIRYGWQA
jgi:hypothetical protein